MFGSFRLLMSIYLVQVYTAKKTENDSKLREQPWFVASVPLSSGPAYAKCTSLLKGSIPVTRQGPVVVSSVVGMLNPASSSLGTCSEHKPRPWVLRLALRKRVQLCAVVHPRTVHREQH